MEEAVLLQLPSRQTRYLLEVVQEPCRHCTSGVRTVSVWVTARGYGETVTWCGHCFNATCERVTISAKQRERLAGIRAAIDAGRVSRPWSAARPAVEDLLRRGLL